jgi:hypothetical protein
MYNRYGNALLKSFVKFFLCVCVLLYKHLFIIQDQQAEKTKSGSRAQLIEYFYIMHVALSRFYDRLRGICCIIKVMVQSLSNFIFTIMHNKVLRNMHKFKIQYNTISIFFYVFWTYSRRIRIMFQMLQYSVMHYRKTEMMSRWM